MLQGPAPSPNTVRGLRVPDGVLSAHAYELDIPPRTHLSDEDTVLDDTMDPVVGALDDTPNDALEAALDEARELGRNPSRNGLASLTYTQLLGDAFNPGVCEPPLIIEEVEHDGEDWELQLRVARTSVLLGEPDPQEMPLDDACEAALTDAGGDVDVAEDTCGDLVIEQFFPDGSACRACVEGNGGVFTDCVESGECPEEAPYVVEMSDADGASLWQVAEADVLACAPDYTLRAVILTHIGVDGSLPAAFDTEQWGNFCLPTWSEAIDGIDFVCYGTGNTLGQGAWVGVDTMFPVRSPSEEEHRFRTGYTPRIELEGGLTSRWSIAFSAGETRIVSPEAYPDTNGDGVVDAGDPFTWFGSPNGWGIQPYALRPDGTNPDDRDDTYARDYIAGYAIKTATTRSGILIAPYNGSRCLTWEGPFDAGSYRCLEPGDPMPGYHNDGRQTWWDNGGLQLHTSPVATIGSTGLPDPSIPGNIVPLIAGTAALASSGFDGCALPNTFVPDQIAYPDHPPEWTENGAIWGDTWRFGAHPELDLRFVLNTNTARSWCDGEEAVQ